MAEKRKKVTIVEIMCVSDTGSSILFGYPSNNQVTMDQVIMMCDAVRRATG